MVVSQLQVWCPRPCLYVATSLSERCTAILPFTQQLKNGSAEYLLQCAWLLHTVAFSVLFRRVMPEGSRIEDPCRTGLLWMCRSTSMLQER